MSEFQITRWHQIPSMIIAREGEQIIKIMLPTRFQEAIDEAAMRILKLAAPYDPFPGELSARHDEIRIAYEWQFLDGSAQGSSVYYADSDRPAAAPAPDARAPAAQAAGARAPDTR